MNRQNPIAVTVHDRINARDDAYIHILYTRVLFKLARLASIVPRPPGLASAVLHRSAAERAALVLYVIPDGIVDASFRLTATRRQHTAWHVDMPRRLATL